MILPAGGVTTTATATTARIKAHALAALSRSLSTRKRNKEFCCSRDSACLTEAGSLACLAWGSWCLEDEVGRRCAVQEAPFPGGGNNANGKLHRPRLGGPPMAWPEPVSYHMTSHSDKDPGTWDTPTALHTRLLRMRAIEYFKLCKYLGFSMIDSQYMHCATAPIAINQWAFAIPPITESPKHRAEGPMTVLKFGSGTNVRKNPFLRTR